MEKGKRMSEEKVISSISPYQAIRANKIEIKPEDKDKLIETVARALSAKKPAADDLKLIKKMLITYPEFCVAIFDAAGTTQREIIKSMAGGSQEVVRMAGEEQITYIRNEMGYHGAPMLEKLLIENIVTCWLRVQHYEQQLAFRQTNAATVEFWERRLSLAQRRYLAACENLARIRKMQIPALQVNIGDKQVNVAGNLQAAPKPKKGVIDA
jgi:hypothetical protein